MDNLPEERLTQELEKVLVQANEPSRFFRVLDEVGALKTTFPELYALKDVPAGPEEYHKEGDSLEHTMLVLDEMKELRPNDEIALLMALAHDLGKGETRGSEWPSHYNHGDNGVDVVAEMQDRLGLSNEQASAMKEACRFHMRFYDIGDMNASTVVEMWQDMNNFHRLVDLAHADSRGREPEREFSEGDTIRRFGAARHACNEWTGQRLIEEGYDPDDMGGENFGALLKQRRVERMREIEG